MTCSKVAPWRICEEWGKTCGSALRGTLEAARRPSPGQPRETPQGLGSRVELKARYRLPRPGSRQAAPDHAASPYLGDKR